MDLYLSQLSLRCPSPYEIKYICFVATMSARVMKITQEVGSGNFLVSLQRDEAP